MTGQRGRLEAIACPLVLDHIDTDADHPVDALALDTVDHSDAGAGPDPDRADDGPVADDRPDAGSDDPDAGARADERAGTHRVDLDGTRPRALRNADRDDSPHVAQPQPVRYDGDG